MPGVHQAAEGREYIRQHRAGSTSGSGSREHLHQKAEGREYIRKQRARSMYIRQQRARSSSGSRGPGVHQGSGSWEHLHKKPEGWEYIKKQMYRSYCLAFIDIYLYKNVKKLLISSKNHQNSDICGYEALIIILYAFLTNKNDF